MLFIYSLQTTLGDTNSEKYVENNVTLKLLKQFCKLLFVSSNIIISTSVISEYE